MSDPLNNSQDADQLRLLAIFHYVCAGLAGFFACIPLIHLGLGLFLLFAPEIFGHGHDQPPQFVGLLLVIIAGLVIVAGWAFAALLAFAGRSLSHRKRYTFCLVMGGVACVFMPFGTVLGVFTIIVLSRPSVKRLFESPAPASV